MTSKQSVRLVGRVGLGMFLLALAGCGSGGDSSADVSTDGTRRPEWTSQVLGGKQGPDHPLAVAVDGDQIVVATVSDDGVITGFAADERGRFQSGKPIATGIRYLGVGGIAPFRDGWVAVGSGGLVGDELRFEVRAFHSRDGRTWFESEATGLDGPADVTGLTTVDGGVVAVGTLRTANDPAQGGFRPVAWHSADGRGWTTVPLPHAGGSEGSVQALATTENAAVAVGHVDQQGVMWSSTDGTSWTITEPAGVPQTSTLSSITAQGDVLLMSGTTRNRGEEDEGDEVLLRSIDGGRTWNEVADPPPPNRGRGFAFPLFAGGARFFTLGHSFIEAWAEPELCYADIELCRQDTSVALYVSDDGDRWRRVDTSGIGEGEAGEIDAITGTDERIVAFRTVENGVRASMWPADASLPTQDEPVDPAASVDLLDDGEAPEPGRRYAVPLYIHCGMEWLYVGGEPWQRVDQGPDVETGAGDDVSTDWPVAQQTIFGFATLVRDDLIEYSIGDGEVIATYGPATTLPPGCE